ncbi:hypothetical protein SAMN05444365_10623 [Micromonospora pattaloongensis]|uniref:Baseplate assembly protein n=1 Tax=Micromonospora pattaloongensis TaxID=405436 RepID=A0A1H3QMH6_9ACTN|nr:hypothetical protein [Micromonospora pattaloongensis]SDZ14804.1 hypothetical protein SAMN05444365_10623 [Micromonospora pattaloongensis]
MTATIPPMPRAGEPPAVVNRTFGAVGLGAALAAAQEELAVAAADGRTGDQVWQLPPGAHTLEGALELGADGVALTVRGDRTVLAVVPAAAASAVEVAALLVRGRAVVLEGVTVECPPVAADLVGVRLEGTDRAAARNVAVRGIHARTATGLRVTAPRVEVSGCAAVEVVASEGLATGVQVSADDVAASGVRVEGARGPQARGVAADADRGLLADVTVTGLTATAPGGVDDAVQVAAGVRVERVVAHRDAPVADGVDLVAWLQAAQARLAAAPAGTSETWNLPPGAFALDAGLHLGAAGRHLVVAGTTAPGAQTHLVVGDATAVAGDLVALAVTGDRVEVRDLLLRARATGALVGVRATGTSSATLRGVEVAEARGDSAAAVEVAAPWVSLTSVRVRAVRADAAAATTLAVGVAATAKQVRLSRVAVTQVNGPTATGIDLTASVRADVASLHVEGVTGATAEAARMRVVGPSGTHRELSLLDVALRTIRGTDAAHALVAFCSGDVAVRGLTVAALEAADAIGVLAVAGGELDWLGGTVEDVRGTARGATGARLLCLPSRAAITVRDVHVEAVRAPGVGPSADPSPTWRAWLEQLRPWIADGAGTGPPAPIPTADPAHVDEVTGLHVCAPVEDFEPFLTDVTASADGGDAGAVTVAASALRRVSGTALQIEAELRDVEIRGVEAWTAVRGGSVRGERVLLAQATWHRMHTGLEFGPCLLSTVDALLTGVVGGPAVVTGPETDLADVLVTFAAAAPPPFRPAPDPLPYTVPGPAGIPPSVLAGSLAPAAVVDLRLADPRAHDVAVRVPGDAERTPTVLGAHPPGQPGRCALRDPEPPPPPSVDPPPVPGPPVDYRARDARSLLALMTDRARRTMPGWAPTGPADHTTMWLELLAARLDALAYRQEVAVAEGYLGTAQARRSVEDHARLVDHHADPGLSATAMIRVELDDDGAGALGLTGHIAATGGVVIPAGTLVVNPDANDRFVVFATESDLAVERALDTFRLAEPVEPGATSAVLAGDHTTLARDRWLVILATDPENPALTDPDMPPHVVRVTRTEVGTDTTRVSWDPRRPSPARYRPDTATVLGNVVPAHHGLPLTPLSAQGAAAVLEGTEGDDLLRPWRERLTVRDPGGPSREVELPWAPVSVHAPGWPWPGHPARCGVPQIAVSVDGEPWNLADDLATLGPADESYVLRPGRAGGVAAVFGDGVNGAALPAREVSVEFAVRIGLGTVANVAAGTLTRLLALGEGGDADLLRGEGDAQRVDLLHKHLRVSNPVAATGGRDPEPLEHVRYAAPLGVRDLRSAVVPEDYERLLEELPDVAAARARVRTTGQRPAVSVTLLLRDEDALAAGGDAGEAERLRRWALARERLESVRLLGFDVELVPPRFVPLDLDLVVDIAPWATGETVRNAVTAALGGPGGALDPDTSGLGGDVHVDALHRRVLGVPGVVAVRVRRLRRLEPGAPERVGAGVLPVAGDEVAILRHPYGPAYPHGVLTVEICGGTS